MIHTANGPTPISFRIPQAKTFKSYIVKFFHYHFLANQTIFMTVCTNWIKSSQKINKIIAIKLYKIKSLWVNLIKLSETIQCNFKNHKNFKWSDIHQNMKYQTQKKKYNYLKHKEQDQNFQIMDITWLKPNLYKHRKKTTFVLTRHKYFKNSNMLLI